MRWQRGQTRSFHPPVATGIEPIVKAGVQFKDTIPPESGPERGFIIIAWNGASGGGAAADFTLKIGVARQGDVAVSSAHETAKFEPVGTLSPERKPAKAMPTSDPQDGMPQNFAIPQAPPVSASSDRGLPDDDADEETNELPTFGRR